VIIGVNAAKDTISSRLAKERHGPGFMHFPADRDINYYSQLTAERSILVKKGGQRYRVWELRPGRANEALDCRVYNYAALCGLLHFGLSLNKRADEVHLTIGPPVELSVPEDISPARVGTAPAVEKKRSRVGRMA
jgi:phage terminase large subunit GpA-like protein